MVGTLSMWRKTNFAKRWSFSRIMLCVYTKLIQAKRKAISKFKKIIIFSLCFYSTKWLQAFQCRNERYMMTMRKMKKTKYNLPLLINFVVQENVCINWYQTECFWKQFYFCKLIVSKQMTISFSSRNVHYTQEKANPGYVFSSSSFILIFQFFLQCFLDWKFSTQEYLFNEYKILLIQSALYQKLKPVAG